MTKRELIQALEAMPVSDDTPITMDYVYFSDDGMISIDEPGLLHVESAPYRLSDIAEHGSFQVPHQSEEVNS